MDVTIIVLIIIIIVLIYFLYSSSKKASANTSSQLYNLNNGITAINSSELSNPKSQSFSYSMWIFVNTWSTTTIKPIYEASGVMALTLGTLTPTLTAFIGNDPITITQNFPIQKWVYIVVSVDSQTVDCYLDGKLLTSTQLRTLPVIPSTYTINFGKFDAYLTGFKYESKALNPQQVWTNYMTGNGYSGGKYGVNVAITKDDAVISQVSY